MTDKEAIEIAKAFLRQSGTYDIDIESARIEVELKDEYEITFSCIGKAAQAIPNIRIMAVDKNSGKIRWIPLE